MGPYAPEVDSGKKTLEQELEELESQTYAYLAFEWEWQQSDEVARHLLKDDRPERPPYFDLVQRLRLYAGPSGTLPFIEAGGFLDQPYLMSLCIEAVLRGEIRFRTYVKTQQQMVQNEQAKRLEERINNLE